MVTRRSDVLRQCDSEVDTGLRRQERDDHEPEGMNERTAMRFSNQNQNRHEKQSTSAETANSDWCDPTDNPVTCPT